MSTKTLSLFRRSVPALLIAAAAVAAAPAWAAGVTVKLVRATLENVTDTAGSTQHGAGAILNAAGNEIGRYLITRRVTPAGTSAYNTAAQTITLFFPPAAAGEAPESVTIQGAHVFSSGAFLGSVSAASYKHHSLIGASASGVFPVPGTIALTMNWLGGDPIRLP